MNCQKNSSRCTAIMRCTNINATAGGPGKEHLRSDHNECNDDAVPAIESHRTENVLGDFDGEKCTEDGVDMTEQQAPN